MTEDLERCALLYLVRRLVPLHPASPTYTGCLSLSLGPRHEGAQRGIPKARDKSELPPPAPQLTV